MKKRIKYMIGLFILIGLTGCADLKSQGLVRQNRFQAGQSSKKVAKKISKSDENTQLAIQHKAVLKLTQAEIKNRFPNLPKAKPTDWQLVLVNGEHKLTTELKFTKAIIGNDKPADQRILKPFNNLNTVIKNHGQSLNIVSGYRSVDYQQQVYNRQYQINLDKGLTAEQAKTETDLYVEQAGNSEHATGLAIDMVGPNWNGELTPDLANTPTYQLLQSYSAANGFILRYPKDKEAITGINFEPWHYRYVGIENAKFMQKNNLSLEEYIYLLQVRG